MNRRRVLIGCLIVAVWLGAMWLLYERELGGTSLETVTESPAAPLEPFSATYAVLADDRDGPRRVGRVSVDRRMANRGGLAGERSRVDAEVPLRLRGELYDFRVDGEIWQPSDAEAAGKLAEVAFRLRWSEGELRLEAELRDGALRGEVTVDGETRPVDIPVPENLRIESGVGANVGLSRSFSRQLMQLDPGESLRFTSFDPLTLGKSTAKATCLEIRGVGDEGTALAKHFEIRQGGLKTQVWLDSAGEVTSATTPVGLRIVRIDEDEAPSPDLPGGDA